MLSRIAFLATGVLFVPLALNAQSTRTSCRMRPVCVAQTEPPAAAPGTPSASVPPATPSGPALTRQQAEQLALKNNPHISVAGLIALAQKQVVRETPLRLLSNPQRRIDGCQSQKKAAVCLLALWPLPACSIMRALGSR